MPVSPDGALTKSAATWKVRPESAFMSQQQKALEKSRLGEILVTRGLVSREQLAQALELQQQTGERLGELMIAQGWLTESQLRRALTRQRSYRYALALTAAITAPFAPLAAFAAPSDQNLVVHSAGLHSGMQTNGMIPLDDDEMSGVTGQGTPEDIANLEVKMPEAVADAMASAQKEAMLAANNKQESGPTMVAMGVSNDGLFQVHMFMQTMNLDADIQVHDMKYDSSQAVKANSDGSLDVRLPSSIGAVEFKDLHVKGANGPSFGDVGMTGIQFHNNTMRVTVRS